MPVANAVPLKAVCALEEVADSCVTDLRAKATQRSVAPARLSEQKENPYHDPYALRHLSIAHIMIPGVPAGAAGATQYAETPRSGTLWSEGRLVSMIRVAESCEQRRETRVGETEAETES